MDATAQAIGSNILTTATVIPVSQLAKTVRVGDLVFIRVTARPFHALVDVTGGWTNHVGIVLSTDGDDPSIGESTFPLSHKTTLSRFISRSEHGRVAVARLKTSLTKRHIRLIQLAARRRMGRLYDTNFSVHSKGQFCSRYAHEVLSEATGIKVGHPQTLRELVASLVNPKVWIMKLWYLGRIPWELQTITPISLLKSDQVQPIFCGNAAR